MQKFGIVIWCAVGVLFAVSTEAGGRMKGDMMGGKMKGMDMGPSSMRAAGLLGPTRNRNLMFKCQGEDLKFDSLMMYMEACKSELKNGDYDRNTCFVACMWKKMGLVGDDGKPKGDPMQFIMKIFPTKVQKPVYEAVMMCAKSNPGPWTMDKNCASYKPMKKCLMKSIMDVCKM